MKILFEQEVFGNDLKPFFDALSHRHDVSYETIRFGQSYTDILLEKGEEELFVVGSLQFAKAIKEFRLGTKWQLFCNLEKLDCQYYYPRFRGLLLNCQYFMFPFGDVHDKLDQLFGMWDGRVFLRPSSADKDFGGLVVTRDTISNLNRLRVNPETLVLAAPAYDVKDEWRLIIYNNQVLTGSKYKEDGKTLKSSGLSDDVVKYANAVLKSVRYHPDPLWTMDVCRLYTGGLFVLEVGSFSCSGWYASDPVKIIEALKEI